MRYGKLIDGNLVFAPNPIIIGDRQIGNPMLEILIKQEYRLYDALICQR